MGKRNEGRLAPEVRHTLHTGPAELSIFAASCAGNSSEVPGQEQYGRIGLARMAGIAAILDRRAERMKTSLNGCQGRGIERLLKAECNIVRHTGLL